MNPGIPILGILVDNPSATGLVAEHGFAVWIEAGGKRILFDTGQGRALRPNTEHTRHDLAKADILVLSHGHYDHTGAIDYVLERNPEIQVHAHSGILRERYSLHPGQPPHDISMPQEQQLLIEDLPDSRLHWVSGPVQIADGVWLTGPIPRNHPLEDVGGPFFLDPEGTDPDAIPDDQALWIETPNGLLVVCGCCHSGLINTLDYIRRVSGTDRIRGIIGGFHLHSASAERLAATVETLRELKPDILIPCHCTGDAAIDYLKQNLSTPVHAGFAGYELNPGEHHD